MLNALSGVADPRARRGVRHQLTSILAVALCAVLASGRSFVAMGGHSAIAAALALDGKTLRGALETTTTPV